MHRPSHKPLEWGPLLSVVAVGALVNSVGCAEEERGIVPRGGPSAMSPAVSASASPSPSASVSAEVVDAGPPRSSAALSNAAWSAVARSPDPFELYPLRGALFVDAAGFLAIAGDGPLRQSPALMRGLENGASGHVLGAYPSAAWIVSGSSSASTYRWALDRWVSEPLLREHEALLDLVAWDDDRAIAAIAGPDDDLRFALAGGKPGAFGSTASALLPAPSPPLAGADPHARSADEPDEKESPCKTRLKPRGVHLAGLPTGELFAAGSTCEPAGHGPAIVERWAPHEARGVVDVLPAAEGSQGPQIAGVFARTATDVLVYGSEGVPAAPYVARFDGAAWSIEPVPFGAAVDTLAAADDGTLWVVAGGVVWRRPLRGAWESVPLPAGLHALSAWPRTAKDVWVSAREVRERDGRTRAVLLRTAHGEVPDPVRLPPRNAMAGTIASSGRFFATAACDKVWVELRTLGPSRDAAGKPIAPPKDFPALKPLLVGDLASLAPTVEDDGKDLVLGVLAPTRELGRKLLSALGEASPREGGPRPPNPAPTEPPFIVCHEPAALPKAK